MPVHTYNPGALGGRARKIASSSTSWATWQFSKTESQMKCNNWLEMRSERQPQDQSLVLQSKTLGEQIRTHIHITWSGAILRLLVVLMSNRQNWGGVAKKQMLVPMLVYFCFLFSQ